MPEDYFYNGFLGNAVGSTWGRPRERDRSTGSHQQYSTCQHKSVDGCSWWVLLGKENNKDKKKRRQKKPPLPPHGEKEERWETRGETEGSKMRGEWRGMGSVTNREWALILSSLRSRAFFFFIFKKNKNFKNICPFWIISKIPRSSSHRATVP